MRLDPLKRIAVMLATIAAAVSCADNGLAPLPPGSVPLDARRWYMNLADDSALSSTIATRSVGVAQERTQLDSAFLDVKIDGSYEQRYWLQIFVNGVLDRAETVIDFGTWRMSGASYAFTSSVRARVFSVETPVNGRLETLETMVFFQNPPETAGEYRHTRP